MNHSFRYTRDLPSGIPCFPLVDVLMVTYPLFFFLFSSFLELGCFDPIDPGKE